MITPPFLKKGDKIMLVAPARKVSQAEMLPVISFLGKEGFEVAEGASLYREDHQFAGSDQERLADLQAAFDDPSVKAVLCSRGGYGCLRLVDDLDLSRFSKNPKWLIGFSDVTVLHNHIQAHCGVETIHGPMAINFTESPEKFSALVDILKGNTPGILTSEKHPLNVSGEAEGILCGGNLSILYALAGSGSLPDSAGKIIFLEDLDEYLYHVDRMVLSLKRVGYFNACAGIVVGGMTAMRDNAIPFGKNAEEILAEHLGNLGVPLAFGFQAGHVKENYPLVFGRKIRLSVGANGGTQNLASPQIIISQISYSPPEA